MTTRRLLFGLSVGLALSGTPAFADEGLAGFHDLDEPETPGGVWGPVKTDKASVANLAPVLLPYFNNGPVFGIPGTVVGDFWSQTQITGDWGGVRTDLARHGWFFDLYTTSYYQELLSGGLKTGGAFVQNTQASINIDTGRAGLWPGGLFHFTLQSRYGDEPHDTFTVGTAVPHYIGLVEPGPFFANNTYPSEYFLVQSVAKGLSVTVGKNGNIFIPDQTLFGASYKYYFANSNFNENPILFNTFHPTGWTASALWTPTKWFAFVAAVVDPNSESDNFATNIYDKVNLYFQGVLTYNIGGLPGQFSPIYNWSNFRTLNLETPFGALSAAQTKQAVAVLAGSHDTEDLPLNHNGESWLALTNFSQYLYVKDSPEDVVAKLKTGQALDGIGVFGRFGYAPPRTNPITWVASLGLYAHGLVGTRPLDSFGVGLYYNGISDDLKHSVTRLTAGMVSSADEKGLEVFYDFAITPAIRLIPDYQHVWDPLSAKIANNTRSADVFSVRLTAAW